MTKTQQFLAVSILGSLLVVGGAIGGYASIASAQSSTTPSSSVQMRVRGPHVGGTITAINGTTITVNDERRGGSFSIEAASVIVMKDGAASSLSSLAVGEHVMAVGTLSGTTLTATKVMSGQTAGGRALGLHGKKGPGVMGTVTAVSGSTITVTGKDGQSYTVNAGSATVQKMTTGTLTDISVGDTIGVHGTVSGTDVTATAIMDDLPRKLQN